jgi:cupin 2 domain-containing protein
MKNLFDDLPRALPEELVEILVEHRQMRIERIVSTGQASPESGWYDQDEAEWVVVLAGEAELSYADGESIRLRPGDHVTIAAHCRHRVAWTTPREPTVWLAVFFPGGEASG